MPNEALNATLTIDTRSGSTPRQLRNIEQGIGRIDRSARRTASGMDLLRRSSAFLAGGLLIRSIGNTVISFEQLRLRLKFFAGDAATAGAQFRQLNQFAARTPFALEQITNQFIGLQNLNVRPTIQQMEALGNIAAASGQDFDQFGMSIQSAIVGSYEPIRRSGVFITRENDKLKVSFRGVTTVIEDNAQSIVNFLSDLGNSELYRGAAEQLSHTLGGAISTTIDNLRQLAFTFAGGEIRQALIDFNVRVTNGTQSLQNFAREAGDLSGLVLRGLLSQTTLTVAAFAAIGLAAQKSVLGVISLVTQMKALSTAAVGANRSLKALLLSLRGTAGVFVAGTVLYAIWQAYRSITREAREAKRAHDELIERVTSGELNDVEFTVALRRNQREYDQALADIERFRNLREEYESTFRLIFTPDQALQYEQGLLTINRLIDSERIVLHENRSYAWKIDNGTQYTLFRKKSFIEK